MMKTRTHLKYISYIPPGTLIAKGAGSIPGQRTKITQNQAMK